MATESKASDLSTQAIALAEQLGRIAGTVEGTAESWLKNQALTEQLTRVRDGAASMLKSLSSQSLMRKGSKKGGKNRKKNTDARSSARTARMSDPAHAPGKKRKKPAPSLVGVKKSDERIPKMRTAAAARQRRKSYA
jgi:hypothetical protein